MGPVEVVRHQHAALVAVLARHGDAMSRRVSVRISAAADELLDPLVFPLLLPPWDPGFDDPRTTVAEAVQALLSVISLVDPLAALRCERAVVDLLDALNRWPVP